MPRDHGTPDVRVHSLASGSSGNAVLVQSGSTHVLIDAGVGIKQLSTALSRCGVPAQGLAAILITHEHSDHVSGAGPLARRMSAPLVANRATLQAVLARDEIGCETQPLATGETIRIGALEVRSFPISHDAVEPAGYILDCGSVRVTYATDVGQGSESIQEALRGANLVVLESNHDSEWLQRGPYPAEMKARVASNLGHLSNRQCAEILAARAEDDGPFCVWLAHLSRVNNSPSLARRSVLSSVAERTRTPIALEVALRDHPSVSWRAGAHSVQLSLI